MNLPAPMSSPGADHIRCTLPTTHHEYTYRDNVNAERLTRTVTIGNVMTCPTSRDGSESPGIVVFDVDSDMRKAEWSECSEKSH